MRARYLFLSAIVAFSGACGEDTTAPKDTGSGAETGVPDAKTTPDATAPDAAIPDQMQPDQMQPDQMQPDQFVPDQMQPDTLNPSCACIIGAKCYAIGAPDPTYCKHCDPKTSTTAWTANPNICTIGGICYRDKEKDVTGCYGCDITKSKTGWTLLSGQCVIDGRCYAKGVTNPGGCGECDPTKSTSAWTIKSGYCYINSTCYKDKDTDSTGCKVCDPTKSTSAWSAVANVCEIAGKCYTKGTKHSGGCAVCDPATNAKGWTVNVTTHCLINDTCVASGTKDSTGCKECDPTRNKYDYSAITSLCIIAGKCYAKGAKHPEGCAECDPTKSTTAWTLTSSTRCLISNQCGDYCSGRCVYLQTDKTNCGKCGNVCKANYVCKAGVCKPDCEVLAGFESGKWDANWTSSSGGSPGGSVSTSYAHDGSYGILDTGGTWNINLKVSFGKPGDKMYCWTRPTSSGRTYMGFLATSGGAWSLVAARNTSTLIIQQNSSWGYSDKASSSYTYTNKWYKLEVEFLTGGAVKGTLYDSDGTTVLKTVTYTIGTITPGGAAIRAFGSHNVDSITICKQ